jgi:hypothetical protein
MAAARAALRLETHAAKIAISHFAGSRARPVFSYDFHIFPGISRDCA